MLTLLGYFGPWVNHKAAALVISGLDLGEYVKFLSSFRNGTVHLWREGFYWPLVTVSLILSLNVFRAERRYPWWLRWCFVVIALIAALNLLPPAWSPPVLKSAEFRQQMIALLICGLATTFSPFLALLPARIAAFLSLLLLVAALWWPIRGFLAVLPNISQLYNHSLQPGWGMWVMAFGLVGQGTIVFIELFKSE
ncbi:MAG: hypothetical protein U0175_00890 [Caldilineaceae bacterium]